MHTHADTQAQGVCVCVSVLPDVGKVSGSFRGCLDGIIRVHQCSMRIDLCRVIFRVKLIVVNKRTIFDVPTCVRALVPVVPNEFYYKLL